MKPGPSPQATISPERLLDWADRTYARTDPSRDGTVGAHGALQRLLGVDRRTSHKWRAQGGMPLHAADRLAVAAGVHPVDIWGDEWFTAISHDMGEEAL